MIITASQSPENSFSNVTYDWLKKPNGIRNLVLKPGIKVLDWVEVGKGSLPPTAMVSRKILCRTNYLMRWADLPRKFEKLFKAVSRIDFKNSLWNITERVIGAFKRLMSLVEFSTLGIQICHNDHFITLSPSQLLGLRTIGFVGSFSSFLQNLIDIKDTFYNLKDTCFTPPRKNLEVMRLVNKIISLVSSIFGMAFFCHCSHTLKTFSYLNRCKTGNYVLSRSEISCAILSTVWVAHVAPINSIGKSFSL